MSEWQRHARRPLAPPVCSQRLNLSSLLLGSRDATQARVQRRTRPVNASRGPPSSLACRPRVAIAASCWVAGRCRQGRDNGGCSVEAARPAERQRRRCRRRRFSRLQLYYKHRQHLYIRTWGAVAAAGLRRGSVGPVVRAVPLQPSSLVPSYFRCLGTTMAQRSALPRPRPAHAVRAVCCAPPRAARPHASGRRGCPTPSHTPGSLAAQSPCRTPLRPRGSRPLGPPALL